MPESDLPTFPKLMIAYITGRLLHKAPTHVVVEAGGLGYEIRISLHTFSTIKSQETCQLFIHQYIKGDVHMLYGFASQPEKQWFLHLIGVNSVGPRTALTILSSLSPHELEQAIVNDEISTLKAIKGIGDKAAQRIVLELRGKLPSSLEGQGAVSALTGVQAIDQEALAALVKLGIGKPVAEKAIRQVRSRQHGDLALEALIKQALQAS